MEKIETKLKDCYILKPNLFEDNRGYFKAIITKDLQELGFKDLVQIKCDIVTIGQSIAPTKEHLPVIKYYKPEEYDELTLIAKEIGIKHTFFSPLTRSSYKAYDVFMND